MKQTELNLTAGTQLRDAGMARVLSKSTEEKRMEFAAWRAQFEAEATRLLLVQGSVTAAEVVLVVGYPPGHPNAIGAATRAWACGLGLKLARFEKNARPSRHAGRMARWQQ